MGSKKKFKLVALYTSTLFLVMQGFFCLRSFSCDHGAGFFDGFVFGATLFMQDKIDHINGFSF
jgi:hypothetical protein